MKGLMAILTIVFVVGYATLFLMISWRAKGRA